MPRDDVGRIGEDWVADKLEREGFALLARNARVGRRELDLVARRGPLLVFCEVKTARSQSRFGPELRLSDAQCRRVRQAATAWLQAHPQRGVRDLRLDAAFVVVPTEGEPTLRYYAGAF